MPAKTNTQGKALAEQEEPHHSEKNPSDTHNAKANPEDIVIPVQGQSATTNTPRPCLRKKIAVFFLFIYTQIISNFDSGAMGVVTGEEGEIAREFQCNNSTIGLLASIVYLGNMAGGTFCTYALQKYPIKALLCIAIFLHMMFTFLFAGSPYLYHLIFARFFVGFTQAFVVVYTPVWVDEFAPRLHATTWLALAQAGTPVGIMFGYIIAGFIIANTSYSWRWIYALKLMLMIPSIILFNFVPSQALRIPKLVDDGQKEPRKGTLTKQNIRLLLTTPLYISTVFALCSIYFVVTTLQLWVTPYLRLPPAQADMNVIVSAFGFTSATAPVSGVITGGMLLDRIGGYRRHPDRAAYMGMGGGLIAVSCALSSLFTTHLWLFMGLIWLLLFFGGLIVPCATGLVLASVPKNLRGAGSSLAAISYSLFGYFLGPLLCGFLAEGMGLQWGFRVSMLWSIAAFISMGCATFAARRMLRQNKSVGGSAQADIPRKKIDIQRLSTNSLESVDEAGRPSAAPLLPQVRSPLLRAFGDFAVDGSCTTPRNSNISAIDIAMGIVENWDAQNSIENHT